MHTRHSSECHVKVLKFLLEALQAIGLCYWQVLDKSFGPGITVLSGGAPSVIVQVVLVLACAVLVGKSLELQPREHNVVDREALLHFWPLNLRLTKLMSMPVNDRPFFF